MKKILSIIILLIAAITGYSQIRVIKSDFVLKPDVTQPQSVTWAYQGVSADSLTINQDTLIYNITLNKAVPMNSYVKVTLDTIAGADTTVVINLKGRMFDEESWTLIKSVTSSEVGGSVSTVVETMTTPSFAMTFESDSTYSIVPSIKPCWRQIQTELIISGDDFTGKGVKLTGIKWYFQELK